MTLPPYIDALGLEPHPEGGAYREIHRSAQTVRRGSDERSGLTVIHFLLRAEEVSRWHVVQSDEAWHFSDGAAMELLDYDPATRVLQRLELGRPADGREPVHVVPAGHWQAARPLGAWALVQCSVGPGFDFADFAFVDDLGDADDHFTGAMTPLRSLI